MNATITTRGGATSAVTTNPLQELHKFGQSVFLSSTGQAYEGGPNSGVFLQVTCADQADIAVPEQKFTFGVVKAAQARGDFQVLADRKRRALRVHLHNVESGQAALQTAIAKALS
jgi:transaldolase/glucose-6-phosphate isomerase